MIELAPTDFAAFFEAVYGYPPHDWQVRLAHLVMERRRWPDLLDLPTGVGKTSALDVAVFSLAFAPEHFPRRVMFVVDRRLIVDQVSRRADMLRQALEDPEAPAIIRAVATRLGQLSGGTGPTLGVSKLRGGVSDRSWAARPDTPWVMVSTVDQVGSRLLFRGYGVSARMQPIHAGLLGNDALLLLDEVHISQAFAETLRQISHSYRPARSERPWQVVEMSATPTSPDAEVFRLVPADRDPTASAFVSAVVTARKSGQLVSTGKKRELPADAIATESVRLMNSLDGMDSVAVVVNRVATAIQTTSALSDAGYEPMLLTGRMRPYDRARLLANPKFEDLAPASTKREEPPTNLPTILVSTQAIEVGADLDFGAMITECAPIDSLRQRFGRVDRRGRRASAGAPADVYILGVSSAVEAANPPFDPVYGDSLREAWRWLAERAPTGHLDVGAESAQLSNAPSKALAPRERAPLLLPSHLDMLVQTSPRPVYGPEPAMWLHGTDETDTDVRVVWRADLNEESLNQLGPGVAARQSWLASMLAARPPRDSEALPIPIAAARRWLGRSEPSAVADIDARGDREPPKSTGPDRLAVRWSPSVAHIVQPADLAPGDLLVVPCAYGGIAQGTWSPSSETAVLDVADLIEEDSVRLLPEFFGEDTPQRRDPDLATVADEEIIRGWAGERLQVAESDKTDLQDELLQRVLDGEYSVSHYTVDANGNGRFLLRQRGETPSVVDSIDFDGTDQVNSMLGNEVPLRSHLAGVGELARDFAQRCGLSSDKVADFELAGRLHDLGKLDPRFQTLLHAGDVLAASGATEPLAKSATGWQHGLPTSHLLEVDRYPAGTRHELLSIAIVNAYPELIALAHDPELVRYLVSSHHGFCRPFAPAQVDEHPIEVSGLVGDLKIAVPSTIPSELTDARTANRFWSLVRKHGWYGLAWYEAIFRLADHRRSQLEQSGSVDA